jgi:hypothetical protein
LELKFDKNGNFIMAYGLGLSEFKIDKSALPKATLEYLSANYKDYVLIYAKKVVRASGQTYVGKIKHAGKEYEVIFNKDGNFVSVKG